MNAGLHIYIIRFGRISICLLWSQNLEPQNRIKPTEQHLPVPVLVHIILWSASVHCPLKLFALQQRSTSIVGL